jgi:hypothetical protein
MLEIVQRTVMQCLCCHSNEYEGAKARLSAKAQKVKEWNGTGGSHVDEIQEKAGAQLRWVTSYY